MSDLLPEGWIDAATAQQLTHYNREHLTRLARTGQVAARKIGSGWVFGRDSLIEHQQTARRKGKPRQ
jgi:hypothetical protein